MNAIEDSLTLVWCSGIAPATARFCLLEIGNKTQGELAALLFALLRLIGVAVSPF